MARRRQRNMPAFQAAPGTRSNRSSARAGLGFSSNALSGYASRPPTSARSASFGNRYPYSVAGRVTCVPSVTSGSSIPKAPVARCSAAAAEHVLVNAFARRLDMGVGRDHEHDLVGRAIDRRGRQGDRRGGVPPHRLEQKSGVGHLVADEPLVAPIGDDRDVIGQRAQAPVGRLEEGLLADEGQEGLGTLGATQRVEPGPAAAGHDDGIHAPVIVAPPTGPRAGARGQVTGRRPPTCPPRARCAATRDSA